MVAVTDLDRAGMIVGLDLEVDFCLGIETDDKSVKKKKRKIKVKRPDSI